MLECFSDEPKGILPALEFKLFRRFAIHRTAGCKDLDA